MSILLKVLGWSLRASAAICITWIVIGAATGNPALATVEGIAGSAAYHAVFALGGVQLLGCAKRMDERAAQGARASSPTAA